MIKLSEDTYITADEHQYMLIKTKANKNGKTNRNILGYFSTLEYALYEYGKRLVRAEVGKDAIISYKEACEALKGVEHRIKELIENNIKN